MQHLLAESALFTVKASDCIDMWVENPYSHEHESKLCQKDRCVRCINVFSQGRKHSVEPGKVFANMLPLPIVFMAGHTSIQVGEDSIQRVVCRRVSSGSTSTPQTWTLRAVAFARFYLVVLLNPSALDFRGKLVMTGR